VFLYIIRTTHACWHCQNLGLSNAYGSYAFVFAAAFMRPMHLCCLPGCASMHSGAFVNARNHRKRTPLHVAAEEGEEDFITFLLSNKADANIPDPDGYTPLDLAAKNKHEGVVKILLQHPPSSAKDNAVQLGLEDVMTTTDHHDIKDGTVKEKISEMSPFGYALSWCELSFTGKIWHYMCYSLLPLHLQCCQYVQAQ